MRVVRGGITATGVESMLKVEKISLSSNFSLKVDTLCRFSESLIQHNIPSKISLKNVFFQFQKLVKRILSFMISLFKRPETNLLGQGSSQAYIVTEVERLLIAYNY